MTGQLLHKLLAKNRSGVLKHKEQERKVLELVKEYGKLILTKHSREKQKKALRRLERAVVKLVSKYEDIR